MNAELKLSVPSSAFVPHWYTHMKNRSEMSFQRNWTKYYYYLIHEYTLIIYNSMLIYHGDDDDDPNVHPTNHTSYSYI